MQSKNIIAIIIGLVVIGIAIFAISNIQQAVVSPEITTEDETINTTSTEGSMMENTSTENSPSNPTTNNNSTTTSYALAEVAKHKNSSSCWSIVNGNIYDLTNWIKKHPGGEKAILQLCGQDGSKEFNGQHGGNPKQEDVLAGFKIGVLAN